MFTVMNYYMPKQGVLSMHCSANIGPERRHRAVLRPLRHRQDDALAPIPQRALIGDDEHGWAPEGMFNFEGGCYAKVINLSPEGEPDIYRTTQMFGTILENVVLDPSTRKVKFEDQSITENTRASYPLHYIPNHVADRPRRASEEHRLPHGRRLRRAAADRAALARAGDVLLPLRLHREGGGHGARRHGAAGDLLVLLRRASSSSGIPRSTPRCSARLIDEHESRVWLVNTGWSGGAFGVGKRMKLGYTRAMVHAALDGSSMASTTRTDPVFGLAVPQAVPGVPTEILDPRGTWSDTGGVRRAGEEARRDVPEELREVRLRGREDPRCGSPGIGAGGRMTG